MSTPLLGNWIGRILIGLYDGVLLKFHTSKKIGGAPAKVYLVQRIIPKWAIGQTWGENIFIRMDWAKEHGVIAFVFHRMWAEEHGVQPVWSADSTVEHEYVHVHQWRREGWWGFGFALKYIWLSIWHGYENNPLEVEARKLSEG